MRLHLMAAIAALGLLAFQGPAKAQTSSLTLEDFQLLTVQSLLDTCEADSGTLIGREAVLLCLGYIQGVMHYHDEVTAGPDIDEIVCPEEKVTRNQVREVFIAWAKSNPDMNNEKPVDGLLKSAIAKWPCS